MVVGAKTGLLSIPRHANIFSQWVGRVDSSVYNINNQQQQPHFSIVLFCCTYILHTELSDNINLHMYVRLIIELIYEISNANNDYDKTKFRVIVNRVTTSTGQV